MIEDSRLEKMVVDLEQSSERIAGAVSADLAALIWSNKIDEAMLISWLKGGSERLRATVSWAVWDCGGPKGALTELMRIQPDDPNDSVRLYCLRSLIDYCPDGNSRFERIREFDSDSNTTIRAIAIDAIQSGFNDS